MSIFFFWRNLSAHTVTLYKLERGTIPKTSESLRMYHVVWECVHGLCSLKVPVPLFAWDLCYPRVLWESRVLSLPQHGPGASVQQMGPAWPGLSLSYLQCSLRKKKNVLGIQTRLELQSLWWPASPLQPLSNGLWGREFFTKLASQWSPNKMRSKGILPNPVEYE